MPAPFEVKIEKNQARFKRVRIPNAADEALGEFFLLLHITALEAAVHIPLSIASGKRPSGFVYHIEGTSEGSISTTNISCSGEGVTQITLGTLVYAKIPKDTTAIFRILIEMKGRMGKTYGIVINRIHYKHNPSDARYLKYLEEIPSKTLRFG